MKEQGSNLHPGQILYADFMRPSGLTQRCFATALRVPEARINQILNGRRAITADTALRLARFFGTTPRYWLELQIDHDLKLAAEKSSHIHDEIRPLNAAKAVKLGLAKRNG